MTLTHSLTHFRPFLVRTHLLVGRWYCCLLSAELAGAESEDRDWGPTALDPKTDAEEPETNKQQPGQGVQTELEPLHSETETQTDDPPVGERSGPFYYRRHGPSNTE